MKKTLALIAIVATMNSYAQGTWAPYASVEENIHFSDVSPSYNYLNLSVPAGNAGMRMGAFYTHNSQLSAEITLGVVGVGTPGLFSNTIIPIEAVGHYNLLDGMDVKLPSKFNLDLGVGSGLAEYSNGNFGFSEHIVLGASMELPDVVPFGTIIMGIRYTSFIDDYIDGSVVSGSSKDGVLRFYTAVRLDGESKKTRQALEDAAALAAKVGASLEKSEAEKAAIQKELNAAEKAHALEKAALMDELEALKAASVQEEEEASVEDPAIEAKGFYVIIGSFPSQERAERFISELGSELDVSFVKDLNTYRVVFSAHENLAEARRSLEAARELVETAWIAVY
ncbi:SPOR domain-containing protein [Schleiferiaceae bacterium]|nr:SPOR domain-containing protein [Schleiferiaceae bacterium]